MNVVAFNNQLKDFIKKISIILPDYKILENYLNSFHMPLLLDKEFYIKKFHDGISIENFDIHILNRNEDLFLKYNFSIANLFNKEVNEKISEIKDLWKKLEEKYKIIIWDYLKILVVLRNRHYNKKN